MTVVLVSHAREVGGAELHLERLVQDLAGRMAPDAALELVCRPDAALDAWAGRVAAAGVLVYRLALNRPADFWRMFRILGGARLVHLHFAHPVGKYQLIATAIARLRRRRTLATHHLALDVRAIPLSGFERAVWFRLFRRTVRAIDRHIAISAYGKRVLTQVYGLEPASIAVIYGGADLDRFHPAPDPDRRPLAHRLFSELAGIPAPEGLSLVTCVARLSPQKGLSDLRAAARQLASVDPAIRVVLIGEGELRSTLAGAGMVATVVLAGNRPPDQVAAWLQASDVFVLPSHFEGGPPLALIEAMASGCAVVATRVSGIDELVDSNKVGVLVEPGQPEALAAAIEGLLQDPERRAALGRRARQRVLDAFDIRRAHAQTLAIYQSMMQGRS